jgi:putative flippase GtrA
MSVSVGTTVLSAAVLVLLSIGAGVPAGTANVIAVLCGIGPSYVFNRRWSWGRDGRGDLTREVVPFWVLSIVGLVVSTIAVARVAAIAATWPATARSVALPAANTAVFGVLWVAQFALLDRVIFRDRDQIDVADGRDTHVVITDRSNRDHHRSAAA